MSVFGKRIKSAMVVSAHPDDEILGCGGTVARLVESGIEVNVLILAEGATSRSNIRSVESYGFELSHLKSAARMANSTLGVNSVDFSNFPDNRMDSVDLLDVIKVIEEKLSRHKPNIVLTHSASDLNIDHQICHNAVITACRPTPGSDVKGLFFYETPSSTEWQFSPVTNSYRPSVFVDISETIAKKIEALKHYDMEMRPWPHPRSHEGIAHLASWRGACCGVANAETFEVGFWIF